MLPIRSTPELTTSIPARCRVPQITTPRAPETGQDNPEAGRRTQAPAQSGKAPGPTRGPTEGGGPLPRPAPSGRCRRAGGAPDPLHGGPLHNHKKGGMLWQTM